MSEFVSSTFHNREDATAAVDRLVANGYTLGDISVVLSPRWAESYFGGSRQGGDSALGSLVGKALRAESTDRDARNDRGERAFATGPIATALGASKSDVATSSVVGALFGATSQSQHREIGDDLERGAVIVAVNARNADVDKARRALHADARPEKRQAAAVQ